MRMLFVAAILAAGPALAGEAPPQPDAHSRALAAGYKAAFTCSGVFNAGLTQAQIAADDLEGIYVQYQEIVRTLPPAQIDEVKKTVSVSFDDKMPPRISIWRAGLGCTQLPIGAGPEMAQILPQLKAVRPAGDMDKRPWPDGDIATIPKITRELDDVITKLFDGKTYGEGTKTTAILVIQNGKIIAERYRNDYTMHTPQRTWSVAKSMTGTLVGRAVQLGLVKLDAPVNVPEWQKPGDPRAKITMRQLMQMNSGLWTDGPGNRTDEVYLGGGSVTQWAAAMPLEAMPGTRYRYANNDPLLAARAVRASLGDGQEAIDFPFKELFWKIGMFHTTPETDWQGNFILSSQVWTTARDIGRMALLYMNDGVWNKERILPEGWAKFVSSPEGTQAPQGAGYGGFFWVYGPKQGLPEGTYLMNGNRGQYAFLVPSKNLIVVRRGFDRDNGGGFDIARYGRDVVAAVK